jgi:hypothetical protein
LGDHLDNHENKMQATIATRKPVTDLTAADLEAFAVWEFATDEEELDGQDESWVKPLSATRIPSDGLSLSVAAALRLASGRIYPGILFCDTYAGFDVSAIAILTTSGRVLFAHNDPVSETLAKLNQLGLNAGQVFPVEYRTRVPSMRTGNSERGAFSASLE